MSCAFTNLDLVGGGSRIADLKLPLTNQRNGERALLVLFPYDTSQARAIISRSAKAVLRTRKSAKEA